MIPDCVIKYGCGEIQSSCRMPGTQFLIPSKPFEGNLLLVGRADSRFNKNIVGVADVP